MGKKKTQEEVKQILDENGYIIDGLYKDNKTKINCYDKYGYKYGVRINDIIRGKQAEAFHNSSQFTIENINNYTKINNINATLLSCEYKNNSDNLTWKCECGNVFYLSWNHFLQGKTYCNKCGLKNKQNDIKNLENINIIRNEFEERGYELLSTEYINRTTKLEYVCLKHREKGVLKVSYSNFKTGQGCIYCAHDTLGLNKRVDESDIKLLTESKGFIYKGVLYDEGKFHKTYVLFMCPNHLDKGIQRKPFDSMKKSNGQCNYCNGKNRSHEDFIKIMCEINPNIMILSSYINATNNIKCKCIIDGYEWISNANSLMGGAGCKHCGLKSLSEIKTKSHDEFIQEITLNKPNIEILSDYTGCKDLITCKCKIDGTIWETTPTSLLNISVGCPTCISKSTSERCRKSNEQFLNELKLINPDIIPLETYTTENTKIKCLCKKHNHIWYVSPNKILYRRTGCPKCASYHNENILDDILDNWGFNYNIQKRFKDCVDKNTLPFDRYLSEFGVLIEYDGEGHDRPIRRGSMSYNDALIQFEIVKKHDQIKNEYCKKNNIPLIRIPYWEKDNMEYYLFNELVKYGVIEEFKIA